MLVTSEQARLHLKVDGVADAADIDLKTRAAEIMAVEFLDRAVYATQDELDEAIANESVGIEPMVVNDLVRAAILLILGHLYNSRENVVIGTIATKLPLGALDLLRPYRRMGT